MSEDGLKPEPENKAEVPPTPAAPPAEEQRNDLIPIINVPALKDLYEHLPEKQRAEMKLTPVEVQKVTKALESQVYLGEHAALPMVCLGPKCPVAKTCPLQQIAKAPIGALCPIEIVMMNKWKDGYASSLEADWNDKMERQAIMDLVESDVLQSRANGIIAVEGFIMENVVGISENTGEPIYRKEKHVALEVKDMIHKRKERLLKSLLATREMKKKLGVQGADPARREAEILKRAREAKLRFEDEKKGAKNAETK